MRHAGALLLLLLAGLLSGCLSEQPLRSTSLWEHFRGSPGPTGPDVVQMEVDLIERPLHNAYLNQGLWQAADEQVVNLDRKVGLQQNGFQVGQLSGIIPQELQNLIRSERSCANPRLLVFHAADARSIVLGPSMPSCSFQMEREGEGESVELEQAQCSLLVLPTLTEDGRTCLRFTPQIKHGRPSMVFRPASDGRELSMQEERPTETYSSLSWEVTLAANEYVLVGGRMDRPQTIGHECFIRPGEENGVQRLLAIRVSRSSPGVVPNGHMTTATSQTTQRAPSLALQASMTSAHGTSP